MHEDIPKCPTGTIALSHQTAMKLIPARCDSWNCPSCGPRNARRLRKRLEKTRPTRLITLTLKPDPSLTPAQMLTVANHAWSILWRRLRRRWGARAVGYAKIIELTKAGTPHLHILVECPFIAQQELSAAWQELTGSYIVDIRRIRDTRGISHYLSSYLTKALQVPRGHRKWSASNGWVPPTPPNELQPGEIKPSAKYLPAALGTVLAVYLAAAWTWQGAWLIAPMHLSG